MRRVLFIAYYFPPIGGSGVQRPTKFVKYLPKFGWQPYVISTDQPYGEEGWDETLLADIPPGVQVWRIPTPRPQPANRLARWVGWTPRPSVPTQTLDATAGTTQQVRQRPSVTKFIRRVLLSPLYLVQEPPLDVQLYWSLRIVSLARRIIEQEQIDVIITTSPPWSALLAGLLLQKLTGRPWVADMRDPWTTDNVRYVATGLHRWFDQHVESLCLRRANAIISVTPHWLDDLCRLADNDRHGQHFCLITNGYDPDDFPRAGDNESLDYVAPIRLYHPGSVYRGGLGALIYGVEALLQWGAPLDLRFEFVGYMHPDDRQCLNFSSVGAAFHWLPERVPHPIVLSEMHRSHVLLLLLSFDCYPGKLFEYMRVGRPILALAPEGAGANLVRRSGTGCVVDPEDSERLVQVLKQIATDYQGFVAQYYHPDRDVINQYDRRVLTGKLAKILDPLVSARSFIR